MSAAFDPRLGVTTSLRVGILYDCLEVIVENQMDNANQSETFGTRLTPNIVHPNQDPNLVLLAKEAFLELSKISTRICPIDEPWQGRLVSGLERSRDLLAHLGASEIDPYNEEEINLLESVFAAENKIRELARKCNFQSDADSGPGHRGGWELLNSLCGQSSTRPQTIFR